MADEQGSPNATRGRTSPEGAATDPVGPSDPARGPVEVLDGRDGSEVPPSSPDDPSTSGSPGGFPSRASTHHECRVNADEAIDAWRISPDLSHRVYVNRTLRFGDIDHIGFDMDYTLAPYTKQELERLSFDMTKARMVEALGYPEGILGLPYDPEFVARGLTVDKRLGNILKIDRHGYVGRAYHGRSELPRNTRHALYRNAKVRLYTGRYNWVDTLFSLPEVALYAEVIDYFEKELGRRNIPYSQLFDDIRTSIDTCHRDGTLKAILKEDLGRYLVADPNLPHALHKLRSAGKRLFVVTNSEWAYTERVLGHLLDGRLPEYPSWHGYFDLVVVEAQKPAFFTEQLPFRRLDPSTGLLSVEAAESLEHRGIYVGGSTRELARLRPELRGEQVLYVGDHIYGDIIRSKRETLWRTALVLEELEDELLLQHLLAGAQDTLEGLAERSAILEDEVSALRRALNGSGGGSRKDEGRRALVARLDERRRDLKTTTDELERLESHIDRSYNRYWGSVFREGDELSRFGRQVEEFACIYTSRVSNLLYYSPTQYFRSPRHWMPHEKARRGGGAPILGFGDADPPRQW